MTLRIFTRFATATAFVLGAVTMTACPEEKTKAEKAGEKIEKAGEKVGGKIEKAGEKIEDKIDERN